MNDTSGTRRKTKFQTILMILLLSAGIGVLLVLQTREPVLGPTGIPRIGKGAIAPDFSFPDLDGNILRLSDFKGEVVFLNIWATWCPPCVEEMPSMEALHQALKNEKFKILAVSIDADGAGVVGPFMKKHSLSFTALTDTRGTLKSLYQTTGVPETFIIDPHGTIVAKFIGPHDWASPDAVQQFRMWIQKQQ